MSLADAVIIGVLLLAVGYILFSSHRRKKGKGSCGGCSCCPHPCRNPHQES